MNRIYQINPDNVGWPKSYLKGEHRWTLPGLRCPECLQTVVGAPLAYPSLTTPKLGFTATKEGCWPVLMDQFEPLLNHIRSVTDRVITLKPGTEFGPFEGKSIGPVSDFMWGHSWYLFARKGVINRLKAEGVRLPVAVEPVLTYPRNQPNDLVEFEIEPKVSWDLSQLTGFDESRLGHIECNPATYKPEQPAAFQCGTCGYFKSGLPEGKYAPLLASSFPRDVDVARVKQTSGVIVVNERFKMNVQKLGLRNILFKRLKMS